LNQSPDLAFLLAADEVADGTATHFADCLLPFSCYYSLSLTSTLATVVLDGNDVVAGVDCGAGEGVVGSGAASRGVRGIH